MRAPSRPAEDGLILDCFAGGGGASTGIEAALSRPVDIAINHSPLALLVHKKNHPKTLHLTADVWDRKVHPLEITKGRRVRAAWFSPDCTHFSRAKGGKPLKQRIRSLAWIVIKWAKFTLPDVIFLENVPEFPEWGPLGPDGKPIKARKGETYRRWKRNLERLGYVVETKVLVASHYGAPTSRKRFFLVARRDGEPIRWPEPTHGPGLLPYNTAAQCIDWSIPVRSIFGRKRPLAEKTLWRIAQGIKRFVLDNPKPFIVPMTADNPPMDIDRPLGTVTTQGNKFNLVVPTIIRTDHHQSHATNAFSADQPLGTITSARGHAVVAPHLVKVNHGDDGRDRAEPLDGPLTTVTASSRGHALVAPTLIQMGYGERQGQEARVLDLEEPLGTVVAQGRKHALVAAFLSKHFGGVVGVPFDGRPLDTVTAKDHHSLSVACLAKFRGTAPNQPGSASVEEPLATISAGGIHAAEVRAFLMNYNSSGGQWRAANAPLGAVTTKDRFAVVTIRGVDYVIVDIGMRMLEPEELLRAQFGRFAADYDLSAAKTKAAKVRLIGNSVCPEVAEALVAANLPRRARMRRAA